MMLSVNQFVLRRAIIGYGAYSLPHYQDGAEFVPEEKLFVIEVGRRGDGW